MSLDARQKTGGLPPVLLFSSSDWDGLWGSRQQIALELNRRGYSVLFIERFAGLEHLYRYPDMRRRRQSGARLVEQQENLWRAMPPPLLPGYYHSPCITHFNAKLVQWRLDSIIKRFLKGERPILWMFKPEHHFMIGRYNEICSVYHCIDEYTVGTSGRKKSVIESLEKQILQKADVVFANSLITWTNKKRFAHHALRFPSGANVEHFAGASVVTPHPEVEALDSPILMYAGGISEKLDTRLLVLIADAQPGWTIILIGGIYPGVDQVGLKKLSSLANVKLIGKQPFNELPRWFAAADICLLPYVAGENTHYRSPLKLYEYLATGRPIVSTPHPEVDEFAQLVSIAPPESWIKAINGVLETDTDSMREKRLAEAQNHSWQVRVDGMLEAISTYL